MHHTACAHPAACGACVSLCLACEAHRLRTWAGLTTALDASPANAAAAAETHLAACRMAPTLCSGANTTTPGTRADG
jgi:hypothetical protein